MYEPTEEELFFLSFLQVFPPQLVTLLLMGQSSANISLILFVVSPRELQQVA